MKHMLVILAVIVLISTLVQATPGPNGRAKLAFVVMVEDPTQERDAALLIESIRAFAGDAANAPIYVVLANPANAPGTLLKSMGVRTVELNMDLRFRGTPLADKVWANAQVEELAEKEADLLVWINPSSLVLAPLRELDLAPGEAAAVRPIIAQALPTVQNVGLLYGANPDAFWAGIYKATGMTVDQAFPVESLVDGKKIHDYFNSGFFAVRPQRGILREWRKAFEQLLLDKDFQAAACSDQSHQVFLHQAVFSAVLAKLGSKQIHMMPPTYGYPIHHQGDMLPERRAKTLNSLVVVLGNYPLRESGWMQSMTVEEPLKTWLLKRIQDEPVPVWQGIYRAEGTSNSYLVETADGNVLIDPGSAGGPSSLLLTMNAKPVKAVLLTHGHQDHIVNVAAWRGKGVPVVAQREYRDLQNYELRLAGFLDQRAAIQSGGQLPPWMKVSSVQDDTTGPNVLFTDTYKMELGGLHFEVYHVGGETPDQSVIWVPERKAVFIGDNFHTSFPNIYTLRGTKARWALDYVKALDKALELHPEVLLPGHERPVWGADEIKKQLTLRRDAILYVHDATVRGMNEGKDVYTLMREIKLPPELEMPEFFGRVSWSVRGIYEGYAGWFDGNPATMYAEPVDAVYPELVKLAGTEAISCRALQLADNGDAVAALHLSDVVLSSEPSHPRALKARLTALQLLRKSSRNGIEIAWLDHSIQITEASLAKTAQPAGKEN